MEFDREQLMKEVLVYDKVKREVKRRKEAGIWMKRRSKNRRVHELTPTQRAARMPGGEDDMKLRSGEEVEEKEKKKKKKKKKKKEMF